MMIDLLMAIAWKSALVSALGLGLAWLVRGHSAAARVSLLRLALVLVLALPVLAALLPVLRIETGAPPPPIVLPAMTHAPMLRAAAAPPPARLDWRLAVAAAYAAVAALLLLRLAFDIAALAGISAGARRVDDPAWCQALDRICPGARLLVSGRVASPLSWGLAPVILLNPGALERPADAAAVLAHEAGHIRRRDWLFLILARVAAALFWFNPLVWWLHGELVQRSEEAVDAYVVARIDRAAYASALLGFAGATTPRAANGMMRGGLKRRIGLILAAPRKVRAPLFVGLVGLLCVAVATPLAAVELVRPEARIIRLAMQEAVPVQPAAPADPATPAAAAIPQSTAAAATSSDAPDVNVPDVDVKDVNVADVDDADADQARQDAQQAQRDAEQAARDREEAQRDKDQAERDKQQAERDQQQAKQEAERDKAQAERDKLHAERDKAWAEREKERAENDKALAMDQARQEKGVGADQLDQGAIQLQKGAFQLRQEAGRLGDPAYRAQQIADAAARGETVTDEHLQSLIPQFQAKADELDQRSKELQARAAEMRSGT